MHQIISVHLWQCMQISPGKYAQVMINIFFGLGDKSFHIHSIPKLVQKRLSGKIKKFLTRI